MVIGPDLVLTIGYLLLEAESVDLIDHQGRRIPGQVRAIDNLTGLGLIRTLIPLRLDAVPLGDSDTLPTPGKLWTLGQNETAPTALDLVSRSLQWSKKPPTYGIPVNKIQISARRTNERHPWPFEEFAGAYPVGDGRGTRLQAENLGGRFSMKAFTAS